MGFYLFVCYFVHRFLKCWFRLINYKISLSVTTPTWDSDMTRSPNILIYSIFIKNLSKWRKRSKWIEHEYNALWECILLFWNLKLDLIFWKPIFIFNFCTIHITFHIIMNHRSFRTFKHTTRNGAPHISPFHKHFQCQKLFLMRRFFIVFPFFRLQQTARLFEYVFYIRIFIQRIICYSALMLLDLAHWTTEWLSERALNVEPFSLELWTKFHLIIH